MRKQSVKPLKWRKLGHPCRLFQKYFYDRETCAILLVIMVIVLSIKKRRRRRLEENMSQKELLFYNEYEQFYTMSGSSEVFQKFCMKAFGEDFSQDGFSDVSQINRILEYIPKNSDVHILDIGCGNGKMLGYLQRNTGAYIHGFDYSEMAIQTAQRLYPEKSDFRRGVIGEIDYPDNSFDVITSMDSMYFAENMTRFLGQIWKWLRAGGTFFCGYQEGDVMPKTENVNTVELAKAFRNHGIDFEVVDITMECYELLKRKREAAISLEEEFSRAGEKDWFDMLMGQTECACKPYEEFCREMARYIFVARK